MAQQAPTTARSTPPPDSRTLYTPDSIADRDAPISVSPSRAAELMGIGRTFLYELINDGSLRTVKIGARRLIRVEAIREFLAARELPEKPTKQRVLR